MATLFIRGIRTEFSRMRFIAAVVMLAHPAASRAAYTFTKIADTNFVFFAGSSTPASINQAGRVAFAGTRRDNRQGGLLSGNGEEMSPGDYEIVANVAVNSFGSYVGSRVSVPQIVQPQTGTGGFFAGSGGSLQPVVVDPSIRLLTTGDAWMNQAGQIAYLAGDKPGERGIYVGQGGTAKAIYTIPTSFTRGPVAEMHNVLDPFGQTQINNAGSIFFFADFFNNPSQPTDPDIDIAGLVRGSLSGSLPTLVVTDGTLDNGDFQSIESYCANNSDQVACLVSVSDDTGLHYKILKGSPGGMSVVTDTRTGPFLDFSVSSVRTLAINDAGQIAFMARFKDEDGATQTGLFTGVDLEDDKVLATGDALFDSTVAGIDFDRVGFNNQGQIAFRVGLKNGNVAIVRADPSDGGTVVEWVGPAAASFDTTSNWRPTNGDAPRVPEKTATISDTALFAACANVLVNLGTERADRLIVSCGDLTFRGGEFTAASLDDVRPSLQIDDANFTLDNSVLKSSHAWIGSTRTAHVTLSAGQWDGQGRVEIGKDAEGFFSVLNGSLATNAESRIGNGGKGHVVVDGGGAVWTTGSIAIGFGASGDLTIRNGATVNSEAAFIGQLPGIGNKVTVAGRSSTDPSVWHAVALGVGNAGTGRLEVENGGVVDVLTLKIAEQPGITGSVRVRGMNAGRSEISAGYLLVGEAGAGDLKIEDGGLVTVFGGNADIGTGSGLGTVTVSGVASDGTTQSTLQVQAVGGPSATDLLVVGNRSAGKLIIDGGLVEAPDITVVFSQNSFLASEISIIGPTAKLETDAMKIGGGGNTGALVTFAGGLAVAPNGIFVGQNGILRGFGTVQTIDISVAAGGVVSPGVVQEVPLEPLGPPPALSTVAARLVGQAAGLSTNVLAVAGNYTQAAGGRLSIPVYGSGDGEYGQLIVSNSVSLDGALELRFINGFAPGKGDHFQFVKAGGGMSNAFAEVRIRNLAPGFEFNLRTNGDAISLEALNDGVFVPPLQGQISSSNVITLGGISYLPYTLKVTNACSVVEPIGGVTRKGNELFQVLRERQDANCRGQSANNSRVLTLGHLDSGDYQVHFISDGVVVFTAEVEVVSDSSELLTIATTPGGDLNLQVNGIPSVLYAIQTSTDLREWFDLPGQLGTPPGPYSIIEPKSAENARFYRVSIAH